MNRYHHTQMGYVILASIGGAVLLIALLMPLYQFNWAAAIVLIILAICLVLFATLTVEIDQDSLRVRFGPGLIRKRFLLQDIESHQMVKNHWYYGWGIRRAPQGWLWNVSGLHAVELLLKNGKRFRIGTDDPEGLSEVLRQSLSFSPLLH
jgi:hypothetical protein